MPALDPESLPRHLDRLYRAAWALCGSPHEAEDLVQETFARVLARPRLLRGQDELAYLMTVLRNTFLTDRRTATRRPRVSSTTIDEIEPVDPRGGERPEEALQAQEVFTAIAGLPERYRLALIACDIAGLSHREAARLLDTKEATVATRLFRARAFVVHALESTSPTKDGSVRDSPPAREDLALRAGLPVRDSPPVAEDLLVGEDLPAVGDDPPAGEELPAPREDEPPARRLRSESTP